jgi:hypothetical protein
MSRAMPSRAVQQVLDRDRAQFQPGWFSAGGAQRGRAWGAAQGQAEALGLRDQAGEIGAG